MHIDMLCIMIHQCIIAISTCQTSISAQVTLNDTGRPGQAVIQLESPPNWS